MRDYKDITNDLLKRRDVYFELKKARRLQVIKGVTTVGCFCCIVGIALVLSVMAGSVFKKNDMPDTKKDSLSIGVDNVSHFENNSNDKTKYDIVSGEYIISCNGVTGDTERIYFDITITRKDGQELAETEDGKYIGRFDLFNSYLEFSDGHRKDVFFLMLQDSDDYIYHLEASALFYTDEKGYFGEEAKLYIGDVMLTYYSDKYKDTENYYVDCEFKTLCEFSEPLNVTVSASDNIRGVCFDHGEFSIVGGGINIYSGDISAANVYFYGECSLYTMPEDLFEILGDTYVICDGKEIPLGSKNSAGTTSDGKGFVIHWITESVIDPDAVTAIYIDGQIIEIE